MPSRIIFIDSKISDYQSLIAQLPTDSEVVLLDSEHDGVMQIAAALQGKTNLDVIDIISHGAPGTLTLGSGILNSNNLAGYTDQLIEIGKQLRDSGDILLYGCDVAQGDKGRQFIDRLAQLTGADVAVSDDKSRGLFRNHRLWRQELGGWISRRYQYHRIYQLQGRKLPGCRF